MERTVRTVFGGALQTAHLTDLPYQVLLNSTLNQKLSISENETLGANQLPRLKYICLGNGGHRFVMGANNIAKPDVYQHMPTDAALYDHLPLVLRLPELDLTAAERNKYRLRRYEIHNGVRYVAYYARVLDYSNTSPLLELRTVIDGTSTSTPYVPSMANLNPIPQPIVAGGVTTTSGEYVSATAKITVTFSESEIDEILNVCNIMYNDDDMAIISEIALCSGADKLVNGDFNGVAIPYTEAIAMQVFNFIGEFHAVKYNNRGLSFTLDIGSVEPLLQLANNP